tara:strand:- start:529 stop:1359 length:831 start_codon:yes stop_codon:yes gene_type:complete
MKEHQIKFWGTRGSFPSPDRDKIKYGGHTSCVEIRTSDNQLIIFDMGTGLVPLGNALLKEDNPPKKAHIFISHFHWDHMIGYLGFSPFFLKWFNCDIYGKEDKLSINEVFNHLHHFTFWPVEIPMYQAKVNLRTFPENGLRISDSIKITASPHGHPNGANGYRLDIGEKSIVYCTDIEHPEKQLNKNVINFANNADILIKDAQFTNEQLPYHKGWGHSSWEQCIEVAERANVNQLILYHHSPNNSDDEIDQIQKDAQKIKKNTIAARDGLIIKLPI